MVVSISVGAGVAGSASRSRWGRIRSSHRGSHQLASPTRVIVDGNSIHSTSDLMLYAVEGSGTLNVDDASVAFDEGSLASSVVTRNSDCRTTRRADSPPWPSSLLPSPTVGLNRSARQATAILTTKSSCSCSNASAVARGPTRRPTDHPLRQVTRWSRDNWPEPVEPQSSGRCARRSR